MKHCPYCHHLLQRYGYTNAGTKRFFCPSCERTVTAHKRQDVTERHLRHELDQWLGGKDSLTEIAKRYHSTRQTFWHHFRPIMSFPFAPAILHDKPVDMLILDATYIHKNSLCALVAIDEYDRVFWRFANHESFARWKEFLALFPKPSAVVMDGQKGLFAAAKALWPNVKIQRCQFHVISFAMHYLGRHPKDEAGKEIQQLLYKLKEVKTMERKHWWILLYRIWEARYEKLLSEKEGRRYKHQKLRSVRFLIRKALPNLFTYLEHPGLPNTTNLVEGWVNAAVAEAIRRHRGLKDFEKETLVSIVLSHLKRGGK
ncbi:MAG TPA: transposase [Candidatus Paceibacterota bacterium]|nr:transposase [Candidatus Paceibacterota bacterium]